MAYIKVEMSELGVCCKRCLKYSKARMNISCKTRNSELNMFHVRAQRGTSFPKLMDELPDDYPLQAKAETRRDSVTELVLMMATGMLSSVQSLSHVQLCDPMDCRIPGFSIHHQLPELAQSHVHRVSDAIQPSHPLSSPSPAFNLSQH